MTDFERFVVRNDAEFGELFSGTKYNGRFGRRGKFLAGIFISPTGWSNAGMCGQAAAGW